MSMPNIPDINPDICLCLDDVANLLLSSVALQEIALSNVINAESEKLQCVLKQKEKCNCVDELICLNESIEKVLYEVGTIETLLVTKLKYINQLRGTKPKHDILHECEECCEKCCEECCEESCEECSTNKSNEQFSSICNKYINEFKGKLKKDKIVIENYPHDKPCDCDEPVECQQSCDCDGQINYEQSCDCEQPCSCNCNNENSNNCENCCNDNCENNYKEYDHIPNNINLGKNKSEQYINEHYQNVNSNNSNYGNNNNNYGNSNNNYSNNSNYGNNNYGFNNGNNNYGNGNNNYDYNNSYNKNPYYQNYNRIAEMFNKILGRSSNKNT